MFKVILVMIHFRCLKKFFKTRKNHLSIIINVFVVPRWVVKEGDTTNFISGEIYFVSRQMKVENKVDMKHLVAFKL